MNKITIALLSSLFLTGCSNEKMNIKYQDDLQITNNNAYANNIKNAKSVEIKHALWIKIRNKNAIKPVPFKIAICDEDDINSWKYMSEKYRMYDYAFILYNNLEEILDAVRNNKMMIGIYKNTIIVKNDNPLKEVFF